MRYCPRITIHLSVLTSLRDLSSLLVTYTGFQPLIKGTLSFPNKTNFYTKVGGDQNRIVPAQMEV